MLSSKKTCLSIIALIILFASQSCTDGSSKNKSVIQLSANSSELWNVSFIDHIDVAPIYFSDVWNHTTLKKYDIKTILLFSKGGKNPEDTLEKRIYKFSKNWKKLHYKEFQYNETPTAWNDGVLEEQTPTLAAISFSKHFGIQRNTKTIVTKNEDKILFLRQKENLQADSTWVIGSLEQPKALISKIGNRLFSATVFVEQGVPNSLIKKKIENLDVDQSQLAQCELFVVYMKNGLPQEAFELSKEFAQTSLFKTWEYTNTNSLKRFIENRGNTIITDIEFKYTEDHLPSSITINGKEYFCAFS